MSVLSRTVTPKLGLDVGDVGLRSDSSMELTGECESTALRWTIDRDHVASSNALLVPL